MLERSAAAYAASTLPAVAGPLTLPCFAWAPPSPRWGEGYRLMQPDVLVVDRQVVDAAVGRGDPGGHLAGFGDRLLHQALDEDLVGAGGQPLVAPGVPRLGRHRLAGRIDGHAGPSADRAAEMRARQAELEVDAGLGDRAVPAGDADLAVLDVGVPRDLVERVAHRHLLDRHAALAVRHLERIGPVAQ